MKRFFANSLMIGLTAFALVTASCNDEAHGDRDRDRAADNAKDMPGGTKPSEYTRDYDSTAADNRTITPDSNRYIGSQVDTVHGQRDNQPDK